jgi:hypothetical protein
LVKRGAAAEVWQLQQQDKVEKLVDWFAKAAARHAEAIEAMHEEAASIQVESLNRFYAAIERAEGLPQFLRLLDNADPAVSGMAAVYAMREDPERCQPVLRGLAALPGLIGFRAQAALDRWESGDWWS